SVRERLADRPRGPALTWPRGTGRICGLKWPLLQVGYRTMSFRISPGVPFWVDIRRIAIELIDGLIRDSGARSAASPEGSHAIPKRCKKLRAVLRLVRPCLGDTYRHENEYFRDLASTLAPLRDVHAMVVAFDAVVGGLDGEVDPA